MAKTMKYQDGCYPENFIRRLLDCGSVEISEDQTKGYLNIYEKVFNVPGFFHYEESIRRRYQGIIEMLYKEKYSVKYVSNLYGISRTRIMQLEARIVDIFRKPQFKPFYELGLKGVKKYEEEVEKEKQAIGYKDAYISELNLTTQQENALTRAGINKISDITSFQRLSKIRNLGYESALKIMEIAEGRGFQIPFSEKKTYTYDKR
jgi:hypothetical protein